MITSQRRPRLPAAITVLTVFTALISLIAPTEYQHFITFEWHITSVYILMCMLFVYLLLSDLGVPKVFAFAIALMLPASRRPNERPCTVIMAYRRACRAG